MKRVVSGIQPTNNVTLGNYIGSIKEFVKLQDSYEMFIFVANLHSFTTKIPNSKDLLKNSRNIIKTFIACGLDPQKVTFFYQSDIEEHTMLEHIFLCNTTIGELSRMTQFKDKCAKSIKQNNGTEMIPTGLLIYPVLQASDILLYDADLVPVGSDQKQHIELTRNIAIRMNNAYNTSLFKVPVPSIPKVGAKIMDLQDPTIKMSKSSKSSKGVLFLNEDKNESINKIKSAITDSLNLIKFDAENQPGVSNLITIYSALTDMSIEEIENKYISSNYANFKKDLIDEYIKFIDDYQKKYNSLNDEEIDLIAKNGAIKAKEYAKNKINLVYKTIGLIKE